jgi:hypothetical protein
MQIIIKIPLTEAAITGMNPKASAGNISQQTAGYHIPAYTG